MNEPEVTGTVMIVDDAPQNLRILSVTLERDGYQVVTCSKGEEVLDRARTRVPDIILLDVNMPEVDGFEVCRRLKADEQLRDVPVLFLSAMSDTGSKVRAFSEGGVDYVTKPFSLDEVRSRVKTHLMLRRREEQLQESYWELQNLEQMRDGLVHMIIHDLRSPATAILNAFSLLDEEQPPESRALLMREGRKSARKLVDMIGTILDTHRMESDQVVLNLQQRALAPIAEAVLQEVSLLQENREVTLEVTPREVEARVDGEILTRILRNILFNGITHTDPETGRLHLAIEATPDGCVEFSIGDNGPGIPEKYRERVFEKFAQVTGGRNSSGLGLAFCKFAVKAHGGTIHVESSTGGEDRPGSVFRFRIPSHGVPSQDIPSHGRPAQTE